MARASFLVFVVALLRRARCDGTLSDKTCLAGWPLFQTPAELNADAWGDYFRTVYGELPGEDAFPLCLSDFWMLRTRLADRAGVRMPSSAGRCPQGEPKRQSSGKDLPTTGGQRYEVNSNFQPPSVNWIWHPPPYQALPSQGWVEVIHREYSVEISCAWFFYAKGSGIWLNLGKTVAFPEYDGKYGLKSWHQAGFEYFNIPEMQIRQRENRMCQVASQQGYQTIQFSNHGGDIEYCPCGCTDAVMNMEIVRTDGYGASACASHHAWPHDYLRVGWEGSDGPCECDATKPYLNCRQRPELIGSALSSSLAHIQANGTSRDGLTIV